MAGEMKPPDKSIDKYCDICRDKAKKYGKLCGRCFQGLNMFMHRKDLLEQAIDYLKDNS